MGFQKAVKGESWQVNKWQPDKTISLPAEAKMPMENHLMEFSAEETA
jgi:hypothetical protein